MILNTQRLLLRPWTEADADSLYQYAKDPDVGPVAGWPAHRSVEESRAVIRDVFSAPETYAICLRDDPRPIGAVALKLQGSSDLFDRSDECELGYWLGKPFWGRGIMPEAAGELLRRAFADLGMTTVWAAYYDGNDKSRRVQEKLGMAFHHTCSEVPVPLLGELRTGHTNYITKQMWQEQQEPGRKPEIRLEKLNGDNFWALTKLAVAEGQEDFVASNAFSLAEACAVLSEGRFVQPFGIYADDTPVGFAMVGHNAFVNEDCPASYRDSYYLWRLMIDQRWQGRGYGRQAVAQLLDWVRSFPDGPAPLCAVSYEPSNTAAKALYSSFGFRLNGEWDDDEEIAVLPL